MQEGLDGNVAVRNEVSGGSQLGPVFQGRDFDITIREAAQAPLAFVQLPAEPPGFTGRDAELVVLADALDPSTGTGVAVVSAAGLAGAGKTALAVAAGHAARRRGWFAGGVLFADLHGYDSVPMEPGQMLDVWLRALGVPGEQIPADMAGRAGLYRSVLAQMSDPVLVIADNASSEAQVRPLLPGTGPHRVVVTSRDTLAGLGARLVDITVLDQAEGVVLLDGLVRAARPSDDRVSGDLVAAGRLAGVCGGLPLALQIAGALLVADPGLSVAGLAGDLESERGRLARLRYDDGSGASAPSVAAAFELSYRRLNPALARVFRLLPAVPGPDASTSSVAVLANMPESAARGALAGLARAHLAEEVVTGGGRWRMHDLVRLYARQLSDDHAIADSRGACLDQLLGYYLGVAGAADDRLMGEPGLHAPAGFASQDDALVWLDAERGSLVSAVMTAAESGRDQVAARLPLTLGNYLDWRRRFDDKIMVSSVSLAAARRLRDRPQESLALASLGLALGAAGRFEEAITAHQQEIAICRESGDRCHEAAALTNLGLALGRAGRFEEAITAHQQDLAICRELGDRHGEGRALTGLGHALREAGRFDEAITALQDATETYRDAGNGRGESAALNILGLALQGVRRFAEAITAYQRNITICREIGSRQGEGAALNSLGTAMQEVGRFAEAITAYQQDLAICRETGDRHGESMVLNNLGTALHEARRFEDAIAAHQDLASICREIGDLDGERQARGDAERSRSELANLKQPARHAR